MRAGLLLVFGCLLLEAYLAVGAEDSGVKKSDMKEESKEVEATAVESGEKRNLKRVLLKKKIIKEEVRDLKIQENLPEKTNLNQTNNSATSEHFNVSSNASIDNLHNHTKFTPIENGLNASQEYFNSLNYSLENLQTEMNQLDSEESFTESLTTEYYDPKKFERRSDDFEGELLVEDEVKQLRKTSPKLDKDMVKMAFKEYQASKIKSLLEEQHDPKNFQRRTFDIMGMLGFKKTENYDTFVKITKEVAVPVPYTVEKKIPVPVKVEVEHPIPVHVPKIYPVTVEKKVFYPVKEYIHAPYPVYKKVPYLVKISIEKPIPVHIEKPYPVYIERKVPYPVEKQIHYPVKVPVDRPVPIQIPIVKTIYYPVEKKVVYPVPVPVEKPVAVPVEKPYPVYVEKEVPVPVETNVPYTFPVEEHKLTKETSTYSTQNKFKDGSFVPSEQIKIDFSKDDYGKTEGGFVPIIEKHDITKLEAKKDESVTLEDPKEEGNTIEISTLQIENKKKNKDSSKIKGNESQEFGRKIKKP